MPTPVLSWISDDGKLHPDEIAATRHEVLAALWKSFPDLKQSRSLIEARLPDLVRILSPMVPLFPQDHPEAPETTLETTLLQPSDKPKWDACRPVADPPRCAAVQMSDQMVCQRCDLAWDVNDSSPPACKPAAVIVDPEFDRATEEQAAA